MASYDYAADKAMADELIAEFGVSAQIGRRVAGNGPAHNPEVLGPAWFDISFVTLDYENSEIDGSRVLRTDKKLLLAVGDLTIVPTTSDTIADKQGRVLYKIMSVEPLEPGGVTLFYWIQGRR